jgi:hypothetical protein
MKNCFSFVFCALIIPIAGPWAFVSPAQAQETSAETPAPAEQGVLEIGIGEARLMPVAGLPKTIIVGDDTTIVANIIQDDILVFTGVAHGKTNVIVLDSSGEIIEQVWVSVTKSGAPLTVRRGITTEEFRCNPACRPEDELPVAPSSGESATVPVSQGAL